MRGEPANLGVQILQLALVGGLELGHRIALLEDIGQAFYRGELPFPQHRRGHPMLRGELAKGLGLLQKIEHDLGLEAGSVRLFHRLILPNAGRRTVQFLGSTIMSARSLACAACAIRHASRPRHSHDARSSGMISTARENAVSAARCCSPIRSICTERVSAQRMMTPRSCHASQSRGFSCSARSMASSARSRAPKRRWTSPVLYYAATSSGVSRTALPSAVSASGNHRASSSACPRLLQASPLAG